MTWDADGNISNSDFGMRSSEWGRRRDAGIPAVIEETGPVYYVREPNGALIMRLDGQYTNYYHFDALGSTRLLTNSSGAVTDTYGYDAWGGVSQGGSTVQPYQFVGQLGYYFPVQDENFPLLQLGVRFYDPAQTGRFTQVDPISRDRESVYGYVGGNPIARNDPSGKEPRVIPELVPAPSCKAYQPSLDYNIRRAYRYIVEVMDAWDLKCPPVIVIKCNDKCEWWPSVAGMSWPAGRRPVGSMTIYHDRRHRDDFCTILHELQHTCGGFGHKGDLWITHCGNLNN